MKKPFTRQKISPQHVITHPLTHRYIDHDSGFIAVVEPSGPPGTLADFIAKHRSALEQLLETSGGLLFTGFEVQNAQAFRNAVTAFGEATLPYLERAAVRREVAEGVFTSTEFSSTHWIDLHHEMSFARHIPARIFFFAETTAERGGTTPIADEYAATNAVDTTVREELRRRGLLYVRNYRPDIDMDWRAAFQTNNRLEVADYCRDHQIRFEWITDEHLRTEQPQSAFLRHPQSGRLLFCHHAHIFHPAAMEEALREALTDTYGASGLPRTVYYGDGAPIPDDTIHHMRHVYDRAMRTFEWSTNDVLLLDNARCLHGRSPFEGKRTTLVSMTGLLKRNS